MKSPTQVAFEMYPEATHTQNTLRAVAIAAIKADRAQIRAILDMDDEEVGDYNEWGDVQRVFMLREALGMDGDA